MVLLGYFEIHRGMDHLLKESDKQSNPFPLVRHNYPTFSKLAIKVKTQQSTFSHFVVNVCSVVHNRFRLVASSLLSKRGV